MSARLAARLEQLKAAGRAGFVPFIMAGDPSLAVTSAILSKLPAAGADIIELGMPFSEPVADGAAIQAAAIRSLNAHTALPQVLELVANFRHDDPHTPIILMGYYNPIFHFGVEAFVAKAAAAGVDGLIVVDVPLEEMTPLESAAKQAGIALIRLIAPTSLATRLPALVKDADGFIYYIAVKGITGTASADSTQLALDVATIRTHTALPIAVGFGIRTPQDVSAIAPLADLVVVGSAIVQEIEHHLEMGDHTMIEAVITRCHELSSALKR